MAGVFAVVLALAAPIAALANGDPASDVLPDQPVFYGSALDLESKPAAQLDALVRESARRGYPINVAVISRLQDMGSEGYLFNDPDNYADFLAGEIACCVKGRLLIVMPGGFGVTDFGHSSLADRNVIDDLPPPRAIRNLLPAAIDGVRRLAAAAGVHLAVPDVEPVPGGVHQPSTHASQPVQSLRNESATPAWLYVLAIAALVALALVPLGLHLTRGRRGEDSSGDAAGPRKREGS